jgi:hypothetical protein
MQTLTNTKQTSLLLIGQKTGDEQFVGDMPQQSPSLTQNPANLMPGKPNPAPRTRLLCSKKTLSIALGTSCLERQNDKLLF